VNSAHKEHLTEAQIAAFQQAARRTLRGNGYNLFAEISLRLIEHYYAQLAEADNLRQLRSDYRLELEFLTRENEALRARVRELEAAQAELTTQLEHQRQEVERLKRRKLNIPPSWES
jgi:predicted nuclease with TOPRIM domain